VDQPRTKASLSRPRRILLEIMQNLNFGHIADLCIERGEPIFDAELRIVKEIKLGAANGPRPELLHGDFVLRVEVIDLNTWTNWVAVELPSSKLGRDFLAS
jgi:hypothetical protein